INAIFSIEATPDKIPKPHYEPRSGIVVPSPSFNGPVTKEPISYDGG
ncbi:MAG: hypothetical protein RL661_502, partial [Pseudomonadota bacterium]